MNKEVVNEEEFVGHDEVAISSLIAELEHVEAPANFERRVKARIAEGETKTRSFFPLPALALAAGAVIVLLVGSIVFYNLRRSDAPDNVAIQTPVAAPDQQNTGPAQQTLAPQPTANPETVAQNGDEPVQKFPAQNRQSQKQLRPETNSNIGGGSITLGQGQARPVLPEGIDPRSRRTNVNTSEIISPNAIPVQDILEMSGISAEYKNAWLVKAVAKNSIAERSGIKAGDAIIAINDKQLTADTTFHGSGSINSLTIHRDGQPLTLKLK
jgi:membrane-associated protease RseP (regulator of RpoE activity)